MAARPSQPNTGILMGASQGPRDDKFQELCLEVLLGREPMSPRWWPSPGLGHEEASESSGPLFSEPPKMGASRCGVATSRPLTWPFHHLEACFYLVTTSHGNGALALPGPTLPGSRPLVPEQKEGDCRGQVNRADPSSGAPLHLPGLALTLVTMMGMWKSLPPVIRKPQGAGPTTSTVSAMPGEGRAEKTV